MGWRFSGAAAVRVPLCFLSPAKRGAAGYGRCQKPQRRDVDFCKSADRRCHSAGGAVLAPGSACQQKTPIFHPGGDRALPQNGSLSVLGPAFSVVVVAISLIAMVGSGLTFMRVGVIGAASYEMMIATTAAETIGVPFGSPEFSEERAGAAAGEPCLHLPVLLRNPDCRRDGGAGGLTSSTAEMSAGMRRLLVPQRRRDLGLTPPCQVVPNGRNPFFYKRSDAKCCVRNESTACSNIWSRSALSRW